jgi:sortase (surface protein transpeptidase)
MSKEAFFTMLNEIKKGSRIWVEIIRKTM